MGKKLMGNDTDPHSYIFWCPGCDTYHGIRDKQAQGDGPKWDFNGDMQKPTFNPSHLTGIPKRHEDGRIEHFAIQRCHSFIENGQIRYLDDCHHVLKGTIINMVDLPIAGGC